MIRRPPRSTPLYSSAASDVYKRQTKNIIEKFLHPFKRDVLPCVKVANQTFYIIAIACWGICLFWIFAFVHMSTFALLLINLMLGYFNFNLGNIKNLSVSY